MQKNTINKVFAGISIDSQTIGMKIATANNNGEIKTVEVLKNPVSLGHDTFTTGKVSFKALMETCEILKHYKSLMSEYKVETCRTLATSAVREAMNRDYIVDQIKIKTGLEIEIINNSEERFLTYKALPKILPNYHELKKDGLLVVDVGSGSIQITFYRDDKMTHSQNLKLGSLRIREVLSGLERKTTNFMALLDEYINCQLDWLEAIISGGTFRNYMVMGSGAQTIAALCLGSKHSEDIKEINREDFLSLFHRLVEEPLRFTNGINPDPFDRADVVLPTMMIFKKFLEITISEIIYTPSVYLVDGIVSDLVQKKFKLIGQAPTNDQVFSARYLAEKYLYDKNHSKDVEQKSLILFDGLKRLHGMGNRQRLLLQLAAIMHDTGKFFGLDNHFLHSYQIIIASQLPDLSTEELEIVANIAKYHSYKVPSENDESFKKLDRKNRLATAKLAAIIKLADALDKSHKQKIKKLEVESKKNKIILKGEASEKTILEQWAFETKAEFFEEVFGVTPVIKVKRALTND